MVFLQWLTILLAAGLSAVAPAKAQESLCDNPQEQCGSLLTPDCVGRVGAGATGTPADSVAGGGCDAQMRVYRNCLALVARNCGTGVAAGGGALAPAPHQLTDAQGNGYEVLGCGVEPRGLRCSFNYISKETAKPYLCAEHFSAVLPGGVVQQGVGLTVGGQALGGLYPGCGSASFFKGVAVRVDLIFPGDPSLAPGMTLPLFSVEAVEFNEVPIQ